MRYAAGIIKDKPSYYRVKLALQPETSRSFHIKPLLFLDVME